MQNYQQREGLSQAERVAARKDHENIVTDIRQAVESGADEMVKVSGIDCNEAKVAMYWTATTYRDDREVSPSLVNYGAHGTGKSQNVEIEARYCKMPSEVISAIGDSFPVVRKTVKEEIEEKNSKTIIIEEADKCLESKKLENFIASSYSERTSKRKINVKQADEWNMQEYNLWGLCFIVHRRTLLSDGANRRRCIVIHTEQREGDFPLACKVVSPYADKMEQVAELQLSPISKPKDIKEGGIWDNWKLLVQIAWTLGDKDWYDWAVERIKKDSALLTSDRGFEPSQAIFESLVTCLVPKEKYGEYKPVLLKDIADVAKRHYDLMNCTNQMVSQELQAKGLECRNVGGYYRIYPTRESLRQAAEKLGLNTEFLETQKVIKFEEIKEAEFDF